MSTAETYAWIIDTSENTIRTKYQTLDKYCLNNSKYNTN